MTKNLLWSTCVYIHRLSCLLLLPPAQWNVTWWKDDERSMSIMETWWNMSVNPDQVSDLLMVTRRLWPQQLAQRKQSWHLDYQFLRMIECCNVLRCVLYMESVSACVYTCTNIYEYGCSANASGAWNGGNFGGRSHQTFHGGRTWGALTGMMGRWEDGNGCFSSSKFNGFYCFACLTDDVRICCGFAIIWYLSLPFTLWRFVLEPTCCT